MLSEFYQSLESKSVIFVTLAAFDIACSVLNVLSVKDENKIKTLASVLILKPVPNPSILCVVFENTGLIPKWGWSQPSLIFQSLPSIK